MGSTISKSLIFCCLLALQFGLQPMLATYYTAPGISRTSIVLTTELFKILISFVNILFESKSNRDQIMSTWSLSGSLQLAAIPAILYAIQNLLIQYGYTFIDSMTFNLLNQTKVRLIISYYVSI